MDLSIKNFNYTLNSSIPLDQKYNMWKNYRTSINSLIDIAIKNFPDYRNKSLLTCGTGESNDLDLQCICNKFDTITLSDIDIKSIQSGMVYQGINPDNVSIMEMEYTGLSQLMFFETLYSMIKEANSVNELKRYIKSAFESIDRYKIQSMLHHQYDVVLSAPIYTQLFYPQIETILNMAKTYHLYSDYEIKEIYSAILEVAPNIINNYNDFLLEVVNEDGIILMLSDVIEDKPDGQYMTELQRHINDKALVNNIYEKYLHQYGHGFGSYGIYHLSLDIEVIHETWFIWPFSKERYFLVKSLIGRKNKKMQ